MHEHSQVKVERLNDRQRTLNEEDDITKQAPLKRVEGRQFRVTNHRLPEKGLRKHRANILSQHIGQTYSLSSMINRGIDIVQT